LRNLRKTILPLLLTFIIVPACTAVADGTATTALPAAPTGTPLPTITPSPTSPPVPAFPSYAIDLVLDYAGKTVEVSQEIVYPNHTGEPLASLVLVVEPNLWPACFTLKSLSVDGVETVNATLDGRRLEVPLAAPLAPGSVVELSLRYSLLLPRIEPDRDATYIRQQLFGHTYQQLNLVDWYPFIAPYVAGEGWLLHDENYYGEYMVYGSANFDVTVHFADPANPPVTAASGYGLPAGDGLRYRLEKGRVFALSFSPFFEVDERTVGGVAIRSYYFPYYALAGQKALEVVAQAFQVFSERFGPYPHRSLSIVQIETAFAMEYDGFFFMDTPIYGSYSGAETDFLPVTAAHETAHQWWFALVGNDQALEPWLDEAFATYSERLYYEWLEPERIPWWTAARLGNMADSTCPIDITIYGFYGFDCYYTPSVYLRGAVFLHDLRTRMGDEAFFAMLQDYAAAYGGQIATAADFFEQVRHHSNADLSDLIAAYFQNPH